MAQWDAPSATFIPTDSTLQFAVLFVAIAPALTRFPR